MNVIHRMGDQHRGVSPDCGQGSLMLQSICPENIHKDQVLRLPAIHRSSER
jgi:hypothetical protein